MRCAKCEKELHDCQCPWVKTYSGGKPNYTQPIEREPILFGGGIGRHPDTPIKGQDGYNSAKKELVGLTDADIDDVQYKVDCRLYRDYARAIEAKLKEKNT